jgi:uncharacterized protein (TIGR02147 family)
MTNKTYIFDYRSYKGFLTAVCGGKTLRRGLKAQLAKAAYCQPTYISQVLHGKAHLSPEQAERLTRFLGLTTEEAQFFLLLLHKDRSGTKELKAIYAQQIEERIVQRMSVVNRLGVNNILTEEQHAIFYSSWQYLAIHMALTIPELQAREALAKYFNIGIERVEKVLEFLVHTGLAVQNKNVYTTGTPVIRLGKDSPHIFKHHSHWRQQAIESLERETPLDLHYSAAVTLSKSDISKLKDRMLEHIKENVQIIRDSPAEEVYVYTLDFFKLKKSN